MVFIRDFADGYGCMIQYGTVPVYMIHTLSTVSRITPEYHTKKTGGIIITGLVFSKFN